MGSEGEVESRSRLRKLAGARHHPNPSSEEEGLRDVNEPTTPQGLQQRAHTMRRNPTEPEKRLWRRLSNSQLAGHKFRRQAVIGRRIVDFLCPAKALAVEVDGETHSHERDTIRDAELTAAGYRVLHVTNEEVMRDRDAVLALILHALENTADRWARPGGHPHPNPSPEGEGLAIRGA